MDNAYSDLCYDLARRTAYDSAFALATGRSVVCEVRSIAARMEHERAMDWEGYYF